MLAPHLVHLDSSSAFQGTDGPIRVFQSIVTSPTAFQSVRTLELSQECIGLTACRALGSALKHNAFPELPTPSLSGAPIGSDGFLSLFQGLEHSACADKLRALNFSGCSISAIGLKALGLAIGQDCLPSLQELLFSGNSNLGNEGVAYLA